MFAATGGGFAERNAADAGLVGGKPDGGARIQVASRQWACTRFQAAMDMQMDVYAFGSSNIARISARANLLKNMFLDFINLRIDVVNFTELGRSIMGEEPGRRGR